MAVSRNHRDEWLKIEKERKSKLVIYPMNSNDDINDYPIRIGGADLSFVKNDYLKSELDKCEENAHACKAIACYVILEYEFEDQELPKIVYKDFQMVDLDVPYIPGFLAFREVDPIVNLIKVQLEKHPELTPNYLMIDGNGMLHCRKFGLACHIGVLVDIPTIGVAKNFYSLNDKQEYDPKQCRNDHKENLKTALKHFGDVLEIEHPEDGQIVGLALKTSEKAEKRCVYISVGHKISLSKAKKLTLRTCHYKIPEPTRQADILSREYIRDTY